MGKVLVIARKFFARNEGAALAEYVLLVGLIAVICVLVIQGVGSEVSTLYENVSTTLTAI